MVWPHANCAPRSDDPEWGRLPLPLPFTEFLSCFPSINHLFKLISHFIHLIKC
jgi:hypothetical protein